MVNFEKVITGEEVSINYDPILCYYFETTLLLSSCRHRKSLSQTKSVLLSAKLQTFL